LELLCPYCRERPCGSADHIFSEFLGGSQTIPACKPCNDRFGHDFEGKVSKDLSPIIVFLSFSGLKPKKTIVIKRALVDKKSGFEYDLNSNRESILTKPYFERDDAGNIRRIVSRDAKEGNRIAQSLLKKGKAKSFTDNSHEVSQTQTPFNKIRINVGGEMRQLAVKMCVGFSRLVAPDDDIIDTEVRAFLLADTPTRSPVRQTYRRFPSLDALRPPLAHVIYIEADPASGRCYGVVQFFGVFQFYLPLHSRFAGTAFAGLGVLNIKDGSEQFDRTAPLRLEEPSREISVSDYAKGMEEFGQEFNRQTQEAFGQLGIITEAAPTQNFQGLAIRIPLLWSEYSAEIAVQLELSSDRNDVTPPQLPSSPKQWVVSPDFGQTRFHVFEKFTGKWNSGTLDRTLGVTHLYVPEEITPESRFLLGDGHWYPVELLHIHYRVIENAWQGMINIADCPGILNRAEQSLNATVTLTSNDVPTVRDPAWPIVPDVAVFKATTQPLLAIEHWNIDLESLVLGAKPV
jgi:hypothetical protein